MLSAVYLHCDLRVGHGDCVDHILLHICCSTNLATQNNPHYYFPVSVCRSVDTKQLGALLRVPQAELR